MNPLPDTDSAGSAAAAPSPVPDPCRAGLAVHAELDQGSYPLGVKVSDKELATVPLVRHDFHGERNDTITPRACGCSNTTTLVAWS